MYIKIISKTFCILLFSLVIQLCNAQEKAETATIIGLKYHKGFIWAHTSSLENISDTYPWGMQLDVSRVNTSQKAWSTCNCYSKVGLSFNYFNYKNPEILGNSYSLIVFAEPFLNLGNDFYITMRTGIGATYLDQIYDEITNPQNLYYSSPLSFIVLANLNANLKVSPQWILTLSGNYHHISNGGMKKPNKGMNFPTLSIGAEHLFEPLELVPQKKYEKDKGVLKVYTRLFATLPDVPPTDHLPSDRAWLFGISAGAKMQVSILNAFSLGIEFIQDNSLKEEGLRKNIDADHHILGLVAGHHLLFGRFDFNQKIGFYAYKPFPFTSHKFYQRYELAYYVTEHLIAGVSLKTHLEVAENFDVRIGYIF